MTRTDRTPRQRMEPAARRSGIVAAAQRQFARQPYEKVSMSGIAAEAGASEALLYRYFGSKADLFVAAQHRRAGQLADRRRAAVGALPPGASARAKVAASLGPYLDDVAEVAEAGGALAPGRGPSRAVAAEARLREAEVTELRELLGATEGDDYALHGHVGFLAGAGRHWAARGCPPDDRDALVQTVLDALFGALGTTARPGPGRGSKLGNRP